MLSQQFEISFLNYYPLVESLIIIIFSRAYFNNEGRCMKNVHLLVVSYCTSYLFYNLTFSTQHTELNVLVPSNLNRQCQYQSIYFIEFFFKHKAQWLSTVGGGLSVGGEAVGGVTGVAWETVGLRTPASVIAINGLVYTYTVYGFFNQLNTS